MSALDLVALVCCDLGAIVRGRSLIASEFDERRDAGVGWVPANHLLTPLGGLADSGPFGSTGDLRLLPDVDTRIRIEADAGGSPLAVSRFSIASRDAAMSKLRSTVALFGTCRVPDPPRALCS